MIYLDYNATAPMKPAVRAAVLEAMERTGNPSSVHRFGRIARKYVADARARVAALVDVKPAQVIFTSSGTEANNMALRGVVCARVIASAIEHDSVLACADASLRLPVTRDGVIDLAAAEKILAEAAKPTLFSLMLANNETGVIQPVAAFAQMAKQHGHLVHCDAVQAAGRMPLDFAALGVDMLTFSAHKIGGPQGMGALIVREGLAVKSLLLGGGQEMNRRAGTENVAGIVGFGVAAQIAADDLLDMPRLARLRDALQAQLLHLSGDQSIIFGANAPRLANTLCLSMPGVVNETQVVGLDLAGIAVSAGSACSSGKVKASHVLKAMGYGEEATQAIRFSLGWNTQERDIARCVEAWRTLRERTLKSDSTSTTAAA